MILTPVAPSVDLDALKASVDLFELVSGDTPLRRESASGGGSWTGPCVLCGGTDRLVIRPNGDGEGKPPCFWCRRCHPKPGSAIDYVAWRDGLTFPEAVAALAAEHTVDLAVTHKRIAESIEREHEHRAAARQHLAAAYRERDLQAALRAHADVVAGLVAGGVSVQAIEYFGWGYQTWQGRPALTIPWRVGETLEAVQYRLLDATTGDKYRWSTGTSGSLWNGAAVTAPVEDYVIVLEGAKKAAAVWSTGLMSVVAVPNNTSAARIVGEYAEAFAKFGRVYVILDPDSPAAAFEAAQALGARVVDLSQKIDDWIVTQDNPAAALVKRLHGSRRAA